MPAAGYTSGREGAVETHGNERQPVGGMPEPVAVLAEVQFGGFTNNAAFTPTPDGVPARLRMGLFNRNTPNILTDDLDSDYDGMVVLHEYRHGVTNRIIGGRTSTSSRVAGIAGAPKFRAR